MMKLHDFWLVFRKLSIYNNWRQWDSQKVKVYRRTQEVNFSYHKFGGRNLDGCCLDFQSCDCENLGEKSRDAAWRSILQRELSPKQSMCSSSRWKGRLDSLTSWKTKKVSTCSSCAVVFTVQRLIYQLINDTCVFTEIYFEQSLWALIKKVVLDSADCEIPFSVSLIPV